LDFFLRACKTGQLCERQYRRARPPVQLNPLDFRDFLQPKKKRAPFEPFGRLARPISKAGRENPKGPSRSKMKTRFNAVVSE
jgi:hypothetical protein